MSHGHGHAQTQSTNPAVDSWQIHVAFYRRPRGTLTIVNPFGACIVVGCGREVVGLVQTLIMAGSDGVVVIFISIAIFITVFVLSSCFGAPLTCDIAISTPDLANS